MHPPGALPLDSAGGLLFPLTPCAPHLQILATRAGLAGRWAGIDDGTNNWHVIRSLSLCSSIKQEAQLAERPRDALCRSKFRRRSTYATVKHNVCIRQNMRTYV